jgi:hypothetical protein
LCHIHDLKEYEEMRIKAGYDSLIHPSIGELLILFTEPTIDIQEFADAVLNCAQIITGSEHGYVSVVDADTGNINVVSYTPFMHRFANHNKVRQLFPGGGEHRQSGTESAVLRSREPFYTNNPSQHELLEGITSGETPFIRFLSAPAAIGDRHIGQISLANANKEYTERDLAHVLLLARLYALAVLRAEKERQKSVLPGDSTYRKYSDRIIELEKANDKLLSGVRAMLRTEEMLKASLREKNIIIDKINHGASGRHVADMAGLKLSDSHTDSVLCGNRQTTNSAVALDGMLYKNRKERHGTI